MMHDAAFCMTTPSILHDLDVLHSPKTALHITDTYCSVTDSVAITLYSFSFACSFCIVCIVLM